MGWRESLARRRLSKILKKDQSKLTLKDKFEFYVSKAQIVGETVRLVAFSGNEKVLDHYKRKFEKATTLAVQAADDMRAYGAKALYTACPQNS